MPVAYDLDPKDMDDPRNLTYGKAYVGVGRDRVAGVARKDPIYDSNVANGGAAHPGEIDFFSDTRTWSPVPTASSDIGTAKVQGRDTNVSTKLGLTGQNEKFWVYGAVMFVSPTGTAGAGATTAGPRLNNANGIVFCDELQALRALGWLEWNFGNGAQQFFKRPLIGLPFRLPAKFRQFSLANNATNVLLDISEHGMLDMRINEAPYLVSPMEESTIACKWQSSNALYTPTSGFLYKFQFEGIRLSGQRL